MTADTYPESSGHLGQRDFFSGNSDYNAHFLMITKLLSGVATTTICTVTSCTNNGALALAGRVEIIPAINQIDGDGNATPHGTIHDVPYLRMQGGASAIILDPQPGDLGIAVFASRDTSSVKANRAQSNPGSRRRHDMSDALYVGALLNGIPVQYIQFLLDGSGNPAGISIVSPLPISITAPTTTVNGNFRATGAITAGFGTADQVTLQGHEHSQVQPGGGVSGAPVAGT